MANNIVPQIIAELKFVIGCVEVLMIFSLIGLQPEMVQHCVLALRIFIEQKVGIFAGKIILISGGSSAISSVVTNDQL